MHNILWTAVVLLTYKILRWWWRWWWLLIGPSRHWKKLMHTHARTHTHTSWWSVITGSRPKLLALIVIISATVTTYVQPRQHCCQYGTARIYHRAAAPLLLGGGAPRCWSISPCDPMRMATNPNDAQQQTRRMPLLRSDGTGGQRDARPLYTPCSTLVRYI